MPEKKISKFLHKLFYILDNHQYDDSISWNCNGDLILIKDELKLRDEIIPEHFSLKKFSSFVRQLHLYNFHKKKSKNNNLIFFNQYFQRDQRSLAFKIVRKRKTKSNLSASEKKISKNTIESEQIQDQGSVIQSENQEKQEEKKVNSNQHVQNYQLESLSLVQKAELDPFDIFNFF